MAGPNFVPFVPIPMNMSSNDSANSLMNAPVRIQVAIQVLQHLFLKTMDRPVSNDLGIQVVEGQKLTNTEANAQATACNLLIDYMKGSLDPDIWEKKLFEDDSQPKGTFIRCFSCMPEIKPNCIFCKGHGQILVVPVAD